MSASAGASAASGSIIAKASLAWPCCSRMVAIMCRALRSVRCNSRMRRYSRSASSNCQSPCSSVALARSFSILSALLMKPRGRRASFQDQLAVEGDADTRAFALEGGNRMLQPGWEQIHVPGNGRDPVARGLIGKLRHGGARPGIVEGDFSRIARLKGHRRRADIIDAADIGVGMDMQALGMSGLVDNRPAPQDEVEFLGRAAQLLTDDQ